MTDEQLKELRRMTDGTPLKVELDPAILLALLDMVEERGRGLKYATHFFDSPESFSDDEFRAVANEVYAARDGHPVDEIYKGHVPHLAQRCEAEDKLRGHTQGGWISVEAVARYIETESQCLMAIVPHETKRDYGVRLLKTMANELREQFGEPLPAAPPETKTVGELRGDEK
jgi:hypothetical protein